jgi:protein-tyrosine phosphatase
MRVLFVCLGNICRSPTVEAIARLQLQRAGLAERVQLDSAGTGDWHVGQPPDRRSTQAALERGYDLSALRGRQVSTDDFHQQTLILAMDHNNLAELQRLRPAGAPAEVDLFLRRYGLSPEAMPDPYYGGEQGFEHVLDLAEQAVEGLIAELRRRL